MNGVCMGEKIKLSEGAGGELMDRFIKNTIIKYFQKTSDTSSLAVPLSMLDDAAVIDDIVFSTDSHTVKPLIFPGGDIGSLSVAGTINDLSVVGAQPLALSAGFIIEEGFDKDVFETLMKSMGASAKAAQVPIVTGDTKVVEKGAIQEFMINTSGIGKRHPLLDKNLAEVKRFRQYQYEWLLDGNLSAGDKIIVSGTVGDHGIALLSFREGYGFETTLKSDVAAVHRLMEAVLCEGGVVTAKDPTRGGLSNTVSEFSEKSHVGIVLDEEQIPLSGGVVSACDMLGIDPFEIGNEGKVVLGVVKEKADDVLSVMRKHPLGRKSAIIGTVSSDVHGVVLETVVGGRRIVRKPVGDPIPRIC